MAEPSSGLSAGHLRGAKEGHCGAIAFSRTGDRLSAKLSSLYYIHDLFVIEEIN